MKLTKNDLKQLIREMMEAEEMEAEVEETEGLDFDNLPSSIYKFPSNYWIVGPERDKAKEEDPGMKELEDHVMDGGEGLILGKSDGRINVLIVFRDINPFTGLDRGVGWGREGHGGGTRGGLDLSPEDALKYLKRGAELIQDEAAKSAFISVTEEDLENMPDDTYFVAKTDKKEPAPEKKRTKSRSSGGYERPDDYYHDSRRPGRTPFRRFEENKLTQPRLKQMIREAMFGEQLNKQIKDALTGRDITKSVLDAQFTDDTMKRIKSGQLVVYRDEEGTPQTVTPGGLQAIKGMISRAKKGPARPDVQGPPESDTDFITKGVINYTPIEAEIKRQKPLPTDPESRRRLANKIYREYMGLAKTRRDKRKLRKAILQDMGLASDDITPVSKFQGQKPQRRRGRKPIFLRKYREYKNLMNDEFGGTDESAFNRFYNAVKMPNNRRYRDYQFGRTHAKYFNAYVVDLDKKQQASEKARQAKEDARKAAQQQQSVVKSINTQRQAPMQESFIPNANVLKQIIREELKKKF